MYHRLCLMLPALVMLMYMQNLVMTELVILSSEYKIMIAGIKVVDPLHTHNHVDLDLFR